MSIEYLKVISFINPPTTLKEKNPRHLKLLNKNSSLNILVSFKETIKLLNMLDIIFPLKLLQENEEIKNSITLANKTPNDVSINIFSALNNRQGNSHIFDIEKFERFLFQNKVFFEKKLPIYGNPINLSIITYIITHESKSDYLDNLKKLIDLFERNNYIINAVNVDSENLLHLLAYHKIPNSVIKLEILKQHFTFKEKDKIGNTPLHICSSNQDCSEEFFEFLVKNAYKSTMEQPLIEIENDSGYTPCHVAIMHNNVKLMKVCFDKYSSKFVSDNIGPLKLSLSHLNTYNGNSQSINFMNKYSVVSSCSAVVGSCPIHFAAFHGNKNYFEATLDERNKTHANTLDQNGATIFHWASLGGQTTLFSDSLDSRIVKQEQLDSSDNNILHYAVIGGNLTMINFIIENKMFKEHFLNKTNKYGWNPLWTAVYTGQHQVLLLLIQSGASTKHDKFNYDLHYFAGLVGNLANKRLLFDYNHTTPHLFEMRS